MKQFKIYRRLLVQTEVYLLSHQGKTSKKFIEGAFLNLRDGLKILEQQALALAEGK